MTNQELQELSKRVAEKFKIDAFHYRDRVMDANEKDWLHEDLERVMRLAIEHMVDIENLGSLVKASIYKTDEYIAINETYSTHPTREQAVIVAVLKALCEVEV